MNLFESFFPFVFELFSFHPSFRESFNWIYWNNSVFFIQTIQWWSNFTQFCYFKQFNSDVLDSFTTICQRHLVLIYLNHLSRFIWIFLLLIFHSYLSSVVVYLFIEVTYSLLNHSVKFIYSHLCFHLNFSESVLIYLFCCCFLVVVVFTKIIWF